MDGKISRYDPEGGLVCSSDGNLVFYVDHEAAVKSRTEELEENLRLAVVSNLEYKEEVESLKSGEHPAVKTLIKEAVKKAVEEETSRCARIAKTSWNDSYTTCNMKSHAEGVARAILWNF